MKEEISGEYIWTIPVLTFTNLFTPVFIISYTTSMSYSDSELMVKQLSGEYKVRDEKLQEFVKLALTIKSPSSLR